jgi:hypothetical protein
MQRRIVLLKSKGVNSTKGRGAKHRPISHKFAVDVPPQTIHEMDIGPAGRTCCMNFVSAISIPH